jgi:EmrB/QacA subfamily drug resistance transporter
VLQAIGAAMMMALGVAIVTEAFPPSERGKALGIMGSIVSVGIVVGPALGGIIVSGLSWRWIFYVNLPIGILGSLMVARFVPNLKPAGKQRFDFLGAFTLFISLIALLLGLTLGQQRGFTETAILVLFGVWLLFLAIFVVIESRISQPMIDLGLFKNRLLSVSLVTGFLTFVAISGTIILMPFYLENVLGYDPRSVGFLLAIIPIAMGLVAPVAGSLSDRLGTRPITVVGLLILLIGYYAVSTLSVQTTMLGYIARFLPIGIGMGVFQSPNNSAIMGSVPPEYMGVGGGLLTITRLLGQITGIAVFGSLWATSVAAAAGGALPSEGASAASPEAQVAGLHTTFLVAAVVLAVSVVVGAWGMRRERQDRRATSASLAEA